MMFNDAISTLGLNEILLQGRKFNWSNMQPSPLLEKLDWVFTSSSWTLSYPSTSAKALEMIPSNHTPCIVFISTVIPKCKSSDLRITGSFFFWDFFFENYWLLQEQFACIVSEVWQDIDHHSNSARCNIAKFKLLRKNLREWQHDKFSVKKAITNYQLWFSWKWLVSTETIVLGSGILRRPWEPISWISLGNKGFTRNKEAPLNGSL